MATLLLDMGRQLLFFLLPFRYEIRTSPRKHDFSN